jgi:hypothetical protein
MPHARLALPVLAALGALLIPASASAIPARYASVDGSGTACTSAAPCALGAAVADAPSGAEVVVAPGTYRVDAGLETEVPLDVHGAAGQSRPWLVGAALGGESVLSDRHGGTLRHLGLKATGAGDSALTLEDTTAEDLLLVSEQGKGAKLAGSPNETVLRDSAVLATGADATGLMLHTDGDPGDVRLVNVTAMAPGGEAVSCDMTGGAATIVNTIARGDEADVDASKATAGACTATHSNFRNSSSTDVDNGGGNQESQPKFVDETIGDYRVVEGTPTDDKGTSDPELGTADPAGCSRTLGSDPDIGAYEHAEPVADACASSPAEPLLQAPALPSAPFVTPPVVAPVATPVATPVPAPGEAGEDEAHHVPAPVLGKQMVVAPPARGTIRYRLPGSRRFRTLTGAARIPVGSLIDARKGRVRLTSALDSAGHVQSASFWGAQFQVRQTRSGKGMVDVHLRGAIGGCAPAAHASGASIARKRKRPVRSLWAKDRHGRYRTHGQSSAATARGTRWQTTDTCAGTRTRVVDGSVAVRDLVRHRTVVVHAGHSYLARARH